MQRFKKQTGHVETSDRASSSNDRGSLCRQEEVDKEEMMDVFRKKKKRKSLG